MTEPEKTQTPPEPEDYQKRVIAEKEALDTKAKALSTFIGTSETFAVLDDEEKTLLREQCELMWQYSEILGKRIARF